MNDLKQCWLSFGMSTRLQKVRQMLNILRELEDLMHMEKNCLDVESVGWRTPQLDQAT